MPTQTERERFNDRPIYTLSEINKSIQSVINNTYQHPYYIKAEIIKLNHYPRNGHCFPELVEKEDEKVKAQMRGVIWAADYRRIKENFVQVTGEELKDGINVLCLATIEYSPQYGLALYIQNIEPSYTLGELARNRKEVIDRLKKEGIFSANKGKTLPLVPKRIAVISVETSKGYSDFIITLQKNNWNYRFETTLFPAVLQGDKAITTILSQLDAIEKKIEEYDCVAIIRGGGGDLGFSCYDNYDLARRVATYPLPILSGIGHSTNETITELVSFTNKITPTEVAYFLIQKFHDFALRVQEFQDAILNYASSAIENHQQFLDKYIKIVTVVGSQTVARQNDKISHFSRQLAMMAQQIINRHKENIAQYARQSSFLSKQLIDNQRIIINSTQKQIEYLAQQKVAQQKERLKGIEKQVELLHPDNVLKRGFSITYVDGVSVKDSKELSINQKITTKLYNGEISSRITEIK